ncbi:MAG: hypothetical protein IJY89_00445 [Clostridia bacterium]|nr:hypothetical protein [Clostridia bacterium]
MNNYLCQPKKSDKKAVALVSCLAATAMILFIFSIRFPGMKAILQLFTAASLFFVVQISDRFLLRQYRYAFENGYLILSTRQGPREKSLGGIPITAETVILDRKKWEEEKHKYLVSSRFSYCQNMFPQKPCYLLAPDEKGYMLLIFEPDETLLRLLNEQIKSL